MGDEKTPAPSGITAADIAELERLYAPYSGMDWTGSCTPDEGADGALFAGRGDFVDHDIVAITTGLERDVGVAMMRCVAATMNRLPALLAAARERDALRAEVAALRERAERRFPILGDKTGATVPWTVAEAAYEDYKRRFGDGQTLERIAERGGFCPLELIEHLGLKAAAERAAKGGNP